MDARWERLRAQLAEAGVDVAVDARSYSEAVFGRVRFGTSYSARLILADGRHVTISDRWWRKNPDVWIGWEVALEGADDLVKRTWPLTKKRGEVVAAVLEAVELEVV
jgi:hypothetical protein